MQVSPPWSFLRHVSSAGRSRCTHQVQAGAIYGFSSQGALSRCPFTMGGLLLDSYVLFLFFFSLTVSCSYLPSTIDTPSFRMLTTLAINHNQLPTTHVLVRSLKLVQRQIDHLLNTLIVVTVFQRLKKHTDAVVPITSLAQYLDTPI